MPAFTNFRISASREERLLLRRNGPEVACTISTYREERISSAFLKALKNLGIFSEGLTLASFSYLTIHGQLKEASEYPYYFAFGTSLIIFYILFKDRYRVPNPAIDLPEPRIIELEGSFPLPQRNALQTPRYSLKDKILMLHVIQNGITRYFREEGSELITRRKIQSVAIFFSGVCSKYAYKAYNFSTDETGRFETLISAMFFILSLEIIFATHLKARREIIILQNTPGQIEMI